MSEPSKASKGIEELEEALQTLDASPQRDPRRHLDVLNALIREIRHQEPRRAFALADRAYALAQTLDYPAGRVECLLNLAVLHTHISPDFEVALGWINQALALLEQYPQPAHQAYLLQCLATIYRHLGDHPTAQAHLLQALTLCRQVDDLALEGLMQNDLGVIYRYTGEYELSFQSYQQALAIAQATDNQQRIALAYNNIGDLLNHWGRAAEAEPYLHQALTITRQIDLKILEPSLLDSLSESSLSQGKLAEALRYLEQACQVATDFDNQFELALLMCNRARVYQQQQVWTQALRYGHEALAIAEAIKLKEGIYSCHHLLAEVYEAQDEPAKALAHYKQFHTVKEELYSEEAAQKLKTLQVIYETETAKREAAIYRLKHDELQAALAQVKQLSGLLPICSSCKKIRDDSGYWQDVAVYIRNHSEAEFSHGLCPECRNLLYPKYAKKSPVLPTTH